MFKICISNIFGLSFRKLLKKSKIEPNKVCQDHTSTSLLQKKVFTEKITDILNFKTTLSHHSKFKKKLFRNKFKFTIIN